MIHGGAQFAAFSTWDQLIYINQADAFANALSTSFTLGETTMVEFYVFDCVGCQGNNPGGITLDIQLAAAVIPEPSTLAIFLVGLAGLGFMMRRRRTGVGDTRHAS